MTFLVRIFVTMATKRFYGVFSFLSINEL